MKFIFPQNYNFNNKIAGIIDYSTAIFNIIWAIFLFCLLNLFILDVSIKIFIFVILYFPLFLLSIFGFNHENIIYVIHYILKFIFSKKLYLYKKF